MTTMNRRNFLVGSGMTLALPHFESAFGMTTVRKKAVAFFYMPNGVVPASWDCKVNGSEWQLSSNLQSLTSFKQDLIVLRGLGLDCATPGPDGAGDHARSSAAFLTCQRPVKTEGEGILAGKSIDQVLFEKEVTYKRLRSLVINMETGASRGDCDSGYSCAYTRNLSWTTARQPAQGFTDPSVLFEILFPTPEAHAQENRRVSRRKSILDLVLRDAGRLRTKLAIKDQHKLDEYLQSVRDIEKQVSSLPVVPPSTSYELPGNLDQYDVRARTLITLSCLALELGASNTLTFMFGNEASGQMYQNLGISEPHHYLTHHSGDPDKIAKVERINRYHASLFAEFISQLSAKKVLDSTVAVLGSGIRDGNLHDHTNLPVLIAGGRSLGVRGDRVIEVPDGTPLANLYLGISDRVGQPLSSFGDSNGRIEI